MLVEEGDLELLVAVGALPAAGGLLAVWRLLVVPVIDSEKVPPVLVRVMKGYCCSRGQQEVSKRLRSGLFGDNLPRMNLADAVHQTLAMSSLLSAQNVALPVQKQTLLAEELLCCRWI